MDRDVFGLDLGNVDWGGLANGLAGMWGAYQGMNTASDINNQLAPFLGMQQGAATNQLAGLQQQLAQQRADALANYNRASGEVQTSNQGLSSNIETMKNNLNALNDPNSPYMQMARQAIERKDAAAGRRSQWGEREVQLAGTLADYVGKYSPAIQNAITAAQNQISANNARLAEMLASMGTTANQGNSSLNQLLNQMSGIAGTANTVGRGAANSAINNQLAMLQRGLGLAGGLFGSNGLFGSSGIGSNWGLSNMFDWMNPSSDLSGLGGGYIGNEFWGAGGGMTGDPYSSYSDYGSGDMWDY